MMKKLLILMLVFGMASAANATVSWDVSSIDVDYALGATVYVMSDVDVAYPTLWIDDTAGSLIGSIAALPAAGTQAVVQDPTQSGWAGYWTIEAAAYPTDPDQVAADNQFAIALAPTAAQDGLSFDLILDTESNRGGPFTLAVTVIPEPMTIALLGLGGLFLLRRRK